MDELIVTRVLGAVEQAATGHQRAATALVRLGTVLAVGGRPGGRPGAVPRGRTAGQAGRGDALVGAERPLGGGGG